MNLTFTHGSFTHFFIVAVIPAWKEPLEGWVDNLNGPTGILVGGAKGVIRSMHCYAEYNAEIIPVDLAINGIIAAIATVARSQLE